MNIILFDDHEIDGPFQRDDPRVVHILKVLRREVGDATDVGIVDGPRGKAVLEKISEHEVVFDFIWDAELPQPLLPIDLIVGLSRPQTCRKILQEATSLGVRSMFFALTDRAEPSYASSTLWTTHQWQRLIRVGVEQAFSTRFPIVKFGVSLSDCIESTKSTDHKICLDNYEATTGLWEAAYRKQSVALAIGSERGWTSDERDLFGQNGFTLAHLGERPQRTETATIAAVGIVSAQMRLPG